MDTLSNFVHILYELILLFFQSHRRDKIPRGTLGGALNIRERFFAVANIARYAKGDCFTSRMPCLSPNQQRQNIGAYIRTLRLKGKGRRVQFFFAAHRVSIAA